MAGQLATFTLFPKFFRHLSADDLAATARDLGLDEVKLMVREGYWVTRERLADEAPHFLAALRRHGLAARFASTVWDPAELAADPTPLRQLADLDVTEVRLGWFETGDDPAAAMRAARATCERLAEHCARIGIRAVIQLHHGMLVSSPSAAWYLVQGLPPRAIGVEADPGNQANEGFEDWSKAVRLLGPHLAAVAIKDTRVVRDGPHDGPAQGWRREWSPIDEGMTDWHALLAALRAASWRGWFAFMPFYHEREPERLIAVLRREIAWMRALIARTEA